VIAERFEEIGMKHNPVINFRAVLMTFYRFLSLSLSLSLSHTHTHTHSHSMFTSLVANPPRTRSKGCCIGEALS